MDRPVMVMARLKPATLEESAAAAQPGESLGSTGLSGSSASAPRTFLGAEAPDRLQGGRETGDLDVPAVRRKYLAKGKRWQSPVI